MCSGLRDSLASDSQVLGQKMRNQQVIYSNSRVFETTTESQSPASHDETQGPREIGHKVALGILCLLLMMAMAVWLTYNDIPDDLEFYNRNKHELQKALNKLTQQYQTLQSNNSLMKEMLRNKSIEFDDFKRQKELDSSNREENRCCWESKVLDCIQFTGKYVDGYWLCSGIKCYFMIDNTHWSGCKRTCRDSSLSLLKIDNDDELKFLQVKVNPNIYWIGLSYDTTKSKKWQWIDEEPSNLDLMTVKSLQESKGCASLSFRGIKPYDCGRNYPCICEKRKDKFLHSVCSMEEK